MAELSFRGIVVGFILIGLFMYLMLSFASSISDDYTSLNPEIDKNEITGGAVDMDNLTGFLESVHPSGDAQEEAFRKKGLFSIGGSDVLTGIWSVTIGVGTMITTPFSYISKILVQTFNIPSLVVLVLLGILLIIIVFAVWKLVKIGT